MVRARWRAKATIIYVYSNDVEDAARYAIDQNLASGPEHELWPL